MWQMNRRGSESVESGLYPERPGEPDCAYYLRTGLCRYGLTCRYNHPPDRKLVNLIVCFIVVLHLSGTVFIWSFCNYKNTVFLSVSFFPPKIWYFLLRVPLSRYMLLIANVLLVSYYLSIKTLFTLHLFQCIDWGWLNGIWTNQVIVRLWDLIICLQKHIHAPGTSI